MVPWPWRNFEALGAPVLLNSVGGVDLFIGNNPSAALLGAASGFLVRNYPPAKIFMGEAGSLFLGFFLGGVFLVLSGSRVAFRLLGDWSRPRSTTSRRALIYGAGDGGALTLRELRNNAALARHPVGFLDDDRDKRGRRIDGLPILGGLDAVEEIFATQQVEEVIIASQKIPPERVERLSAMCTTRGVLVTRASLWMQ